MDLAKKILILTLSLLFLSPTILPNLCSATELPSTKTDSSTCFSEPDHSHHQHPTCNNESKTPCPSNYSCCNLTAQIGTPYLIVLDFHFATSVEIFFHTLEVTKSLYHPPRPLLYPVVA